MYNGRVNSLTNIDVAAEVSGRILAGNIVLKDGETFRKGDVLSKCQVAIAKNNEKSAQVELDQMKHSLQNQLLTYYANYQVNKEVYKLAEEQIKTAKLNLEIFRQKDDQGAINSFNFRDVQNTYLNAVASHVEALYNLISIETDLLQISGNIVGYHQ